MAGNATAWNWLLVLGLDFDPPERDAAAIKQSLVSLQNSLGDKMTVSDQKDFYIGLSEALKKGIDNVCDNVIMPNIDALASDAQDIVYGVLDDRLQAFAEVQGVTVPQAQVGKFAKAVNKKVKNLGGGPDFKLDPAVVEKRMAARGMSVAGADDSGAADDSAAAIAAYDKYKAKVEGEVGFNAMTPMLVQFGKQDLYEHCCPPNCSDPRAAAGADLIAAAQAVQDATVVNAANWPAASGLFEKAKEIFGDASQRAHYDAYLAKLEVASILAEAKELALDDTINEALARRTIAKLTAVISEKTDAPLILAGYCAGKNAPKLQKPRKDLIMCRCGYFNEGDAKNCADCGQALEVRCPSCGKKVSNVVSRCPGCGGEVGDALKKAEWHCKNARLLLKSYAFDGAKEQLKRAEAAWPGFAEIAVIRREIEAGEQAMGPAASQLMIAIADKRFYAARDAYRSIQSRNPGFMQTDVESQINGGIESAEALLAEAESLPVDDAVRKWNQALQVCADCAQALDRLRQNPPVAPTGLSIAPDGRNHEMRLSWSPSTSAGVSGYIVVRKEGMAPLNVDDGVRVTTTTVANAQDKGVEVGVGYYYAVFAERYSVTSSPLASAEASVLLSDVEDLRAVSNDGAVELRWQPLSAGGKAEVFDVQDGVAGVMLGTTPSTSFSVTGLVNDQPYEFLVKVVYEVAGAILRTEGVKVSATPFKPGATIEDFRVTRSRANEGLFDLSWTEDADDVVVVFGSTDSSVELPVVGDAVSVSELDASFDRIALANQKSGSAQILYSGERPLRLFPVAVHGKSAVVGNPGRAVSVEEVSITKVNIVNNQICVRLDLKCAVHRFIILVRNDRFARDLADRKGAAVEKVAGETFSRDGMLKLKVPVSSDDFYISVFAERALGSGDYTDPGEFLFSNRESAKIYYSIDVAKKLFGAPSVSLSFWSDDSRFTLPDLRVEYARKSVPLRQPGVLATTIPGQEIAGKRSFPIENLPKQSDICLIAKSLDGTKLTLVNTSGRPNYQVS